MNSPNQDNLSLALVHRPSSYYYVFNIDDDNSWLPEFSPGSEAELFISDSDLDNWKDKLTSIQAWLRYLKREMEAPDLWAAISNEETLAEAASSEEMEDTPFTPEEVKYLSGAMKEIREYIASTQNLSPEIQSFVNDRINYLEESSKRQGRKAWIHTTIGVLFTIIIGAAFSPSAARELFQFAGSVLAQILKSQRLLP